ncbi:hypothetical protein JJL45_05320 [Tamlana sp. s12]|uniref:hypothetical protein n=1 Tax=Tamlana sp. s12 TaxID=1630406 RepID=UPI00080171C3|nr:hypothetical protein [Tamlana sp. s12]OBQ56075.1 hypothetical protein VQ01_06740 [Tamlana sp. s12]QQY83412.1 hypothetical protein JJL45_05320 [Tamlana sp. s12]
MTEIKIANITVQYAEAEKLVKYLNIKLKDNETLIIENFAVWSDKFGIDIDCCFWNIVKKHIENEFVMCIDIECRIKKYHENGTATIRIDRPDFVKTITLKEYLKLAEDVQLVDFIRYNYNPRIIQNQKLLIKYIKEIDESRDTTT